MASGVCASRCPALLRFRVDFSRRFASPSSLFAASGHSAPLQQQQHFHSIRPRIHQLMRTHSADQQRLFDASISWSRRGRRYASSVYSTSDATSSGESTLSPALVQDVTVTYIRGLPHVVVPLPSRSEKCQFTLRPVSHTVGDFLRMLHAEDKGIDRAAIFNIDGIRIAAACSIENLMNDEFWLNINDKRYHVQPPKRAKLSIEDSSQIGDVRALVSQLYEALHVEEHQVKKEHELASRLEELTDQLLPFEKVQNELALAAERRTEMLTWVGLGMMGVQFGILARLTWWEYSWDIMEPVTYFVTYGTAMAAYAYYCLTKQEYNMPDVKDRQYLITMHKKARKHNFDVDRYNQLKRELADVQTDLRRLRDPLYHRYSNAAALAPPHGGSGDANGNLLGLPRPKGKIAAILDSAAQKWRK